MLNYITNLSGSSNRVRMPSIAQLDRALAIVQRELEELGLWDEDLSEVEVYLGTIGSEFGTYM